MTKFISIVLKHYHRFLDEWKANERRRQLIEQYKSYVPKYRSRTKHDHDVIRQQITPDPTVCSHIKGGRHRLRLITKDYAISVHTYIDNRTVVRCLLCGKEWDRFDKEAEKMIKNTSNTPTSSERDLYNIRATINGEVLYFESAQALKDRYPEWDGKIVKLGGKYVTHYDLYD